MSRHILGVDVVPTNNDKILHLFDTSSYAEGLGITCPRLEVTIPGFRTARLLEPEDGFNVSLNGITLDLISPAAEYLPPLPDGLYHIKYSISPNDLVYVEFDYLRTVIFDNLLFKERCELDLCDHTPLPEVKEKLKAINEIEDYVKAAKGAVSACDDLDKAHDLFVYAKTLLERYSSSCC